MPIRRKTRFDPHVAFHAHACRYFIATRAHASRPNAERKATRQRDTGRFSQHAKNALSSDSLRKRQ